VSEGKVTACKCCGVDFTRPDVKKWAEYVAGRGYKVSSVYRCEVHNKAEGGSPNSRHMRGDAVDVHFPNSEKYNLAFLRMIVEAKPDTVLHYPWGFHLDWRKGSAVPEGR